MARAGPHGSRRASRSSPLGSTIQPHILESEIVILAVVVRLEVSHVRLSGIGGGAVQDHWARGILDQDALDVPDYLLALLLVELSRLRREQLVDLRIAILRVVALGIAGIIFDHISSGIVDADAGDVEPDGVFLAGELCVPARGVENVALADDIDLLELIG